MPKLRKEVPDETDLELLALLYYKGKATATELAKEIELSKATISDRLKWLAEKGYLEEPEIDISTGKLRKVYKSPSKEKLKSAFLEYYRTEIYEPVTEEFAIGVKYSSLEEAYKDYPLEKAYEDDRINWLSSIPATILRKLREGISLKNAAKLLIQENWKYPYSEILGCELFGLIAVENGIVKLTEKGLKAILNEWIPEIKEKLKELRELDFEAYKKLLAEFCNDL